MRTTPDEPAKIMSSEQEDFEPWQSTKSLSPELRKNMIQHAREYVNALDEIIQVLPRGDIKKLNICEIGRHQETLREAIGDLPCDIRNPVERGLDVCRSRDQSTLQQFLAELPPEWLLISPVCEREYPSDRSERAMSQSCWQAV